MYNLKKTLHSYCLTWKIYTITSLLYAKKRFVKCTGNKSQTSCKFHESLFCLHKLLEIHELNHQLFAYENKKDHILIRNNYITPIITY